jgi:hypothetical protein
VPILGYFLLALAVSHGYLAPHLTPANPALVLLASCLVAGSVGIILGLACGGTLHLGARLVAGQRSLATTLRALGYALIGPCLIAVPATLALSLLPRTARTALLTVLVATSIWGAYLILSVVRSTHELSWLRALVAAVLFIVLTIGLIGAATIALGLAVYSLLRF